MPNEFRSNDLQKVSFWLDIRIGTFQEKIGENYDYVCERNNRRGWHGLCSD